MYIIVFIFLDGGFKKENNDKLAQTVVTTCETPSVVQREPTPSDFAKVSVL